MELHSTNAGVGGSRHLFSTPEQDKARRTEDELHLLRMCVEDKEAKIRNVTRDLSHAHDDLTRTQHLLQEKKETILRYQDRVNDLQAENAGLKMRFTGGSPSGAAGGGAGALPLDPSPALREENTRLKMQVRDLQAQCEEMRLRVDSEQTSHQMWKMRCQQMEMDRERERRERREMNGLGGGGGGPVNSHQMDALIAEKQVLQQQVMTYKEDFEKERHDRVRVHDELQNIKDENEGLRLTIRIMANEHNFNLQDYGL